MKKSNINIGYGSAICLTNVEVPYDIEELKELNKNKDAVYIVPLSLELFLLLIEDKVKTMRPE